MEYKKVEVFVPNDSQPHLCRITTNDYQTQIEWLEPIENSEQDELWKGAVGIMADDILDRRQKNIPASVPELIKKLSSKYHLIKK